MLKKVGVFEEAVERVKGNWCREVEGVIIRRDCY